MRIERIELDGFGRFQAARWELEEGITVLLGANEAGKTTLLNALRALLFGFEPTRDGRTWYPALAGGRRGGRLVLRTAGGERWTVERHGEKGGAGALAVRAPNGNQGGQETLDRLLRGVDRDLFNNIFAFGLSELQTFSSLSADGVRGRIYGAGAGLGGTSAVDLERRLRQQLEATFLPRGSQRPLNVLMARIEKLRADIADLARQPEEHAIAHREREELRERATALRDEARDERERAARIANLLAAVPLAADLGGVEHELAAGDATLDALPADAVAVLDRRLGAVAEAQATLAALDEQLAAARASRAGIEVDDRILSAGDEILALRDEHAARVAAVTRRRELEAAEARHAAAVSEQLARAGGWDEPRLLALEDSIAVTEALRDLDQRMSQARAAHAAAEQRRRAAADELAAREREAGGSDGLDGDADTRRDALDRLDALRMRRVAAEARRGAPLGGIGLPKAVALGALLVLVAIAAGLLTEATVMGAIIGAVLAALVIFLATSGGGTGEIERLDAERRALLGEVGLPPGAGDSEMRALAAELADARARHALARTHRVALDARRDETDRREREAAAAADALAAAQRAWSDWLGARGLPAELTPDAARQILGAAGAARRAAAERDEQRRLLAALDDDDTAFAAVVDRLSASLGLPPATDAARRDAVLAGLIDRLERSRQAQRRALELDETIRQLEARREPAAVTVAEREEAVAAHLAAVRCEDADLLRRRDAAASERRALGTRVRELRAGIAGIAGRAEAVDDLVKEARKSDPSALEASLLEARAECERLEADEREALNRIGALDVRIRQLEAAEDLGTRRQELAVLEGRAAAMAREWAVRALALRLLEETRSRYERERQPDVVRAAESHFERITDGRYARIVAPPGDASVRVETDGGESRTTDELSRGTSEQLYLALRFGLIEEFARHAEPLPVVMDEILVNFDADRAARAAAAIMDLAARHQLLYFTCHRWTAELLDPVGTRTLTLD